MTEPTGSDKTAPIVTQRRRPRAGERTRGAADALQTKIAVNLQHLARSRLTDQLRDNIAEIPEAAGCDAAFLALFDASANAIESIYSSSALFCSCNPDALAKDSLDDWPWLTKRLGHLRLVEIADTDRATAKSRDEFERLAELGIGSCLIIGFSVRDTVAGFLAVANERPVEHWDASQHLLMKLIGASLASGLERLQSAALLHELEDRNELISRCRRRSRASLSSDATGAAVCSRRRNPRCRRSPSG